MMGWLIGIAVVVLGVIVIARVVFPRDEHGPTANPRRLFRGLCRAHRLNWADRRLLHKLARSRGLADPSRLFIDPRCFDREAASGPLLPYATRMAELRRRLFGG